MVELADVRDFFFKAMMKGWIGDDADAQGFDVQGNKTFTFRDGNLCLVDSYFTTLLGPGSAGTTTIRFRDNPVWFMQYGGWYEGEAAECVKAALRETYGKCKFVGGRGPIVRLDGPLLYVNWPNRNDFSFFSGREQVFGPNDKVFGWHEYWGMSLIGPPPA